MNRRKEKLLRGYLCELINNNDFKIIFAPHIYTEHLVVQLVKKVEFYEQALID